MGEALSLVTLAQAGVSVGQVLEWPIYDKDGQVLFEAGLKIADNQQLQQLLSVGFCNSDFLWDSIPSTLTPIVEKTAAATVQTASEGLNKEAIIELDNVRWMVGEVLHLQARDQAATRYTVKLIGFIKNKSLLVTAPTVDGKAALLREGVSFIIRAFPGKKAYAFTGILDKYVYSPHAYLHLSYPKEVRATTIRQGARATVKIIASVGVGNPEQISAMTIGDLSMGGASGIAKKQLANKGDIVTIKFKVRAADNDEYLSLKAILRSVAPTENTQEFRQGFEFIEITPQAKLVLSAFVHRTLAEMD